MQLLAPKQRGRELKTTGGLDTWARFSLIKHAFPQPEAVRQLSASSLSRWPCVPPHSPPDLPASAVCHKKWFAELVLLGTIIVRCCSSGELWSQSCCWPLLFSTTHALESLAQTGVLQAWLFSV